MSRHTNEWKELLASQKSSRSDLQYLHSLYESELTTLDKDYTYITNVIQRQILEIRVLQITNQEERMLLREKHDQEIKAH